MCNVSERFGSGSRRCHFEGLLNLNGLKTGIEETELDLGNRNGPKAQKSTNLLFFSGYDFRALYVILSLRLGI
jgi:hypothetical protein